MFSYLSELLKKDSGTMERNKIPFTMQVADNPKVIGVQSGLNAMKAAGAQKEFISANIAQAHGLNSPIILRAGDPPQYNKKRSPKSGLNLTKTSKQGFFKGALAKEERFSRLDANGEPFPHNKKDKEHLELGPHDPDYQHTMQLDINMMDIIREVRPGGDLEILGYDKKSGTLRLGYKDGKRPPKDQFNGQFIINLKSGDDSPHFYSREWDKPENDTDWDSKEKIIKKPDELSDISDSFYKKIFYHNFKVYYTEEKTADLSRLDVKKAEVFANRPRTAKEFKQTMDKSHPAYKKIKDAKSMSEVLNTLAAQQNGDEIILSVYDKGGSIIAGDWDGMALGHPPNLNPKYKQVLNTFSPGKKGIEAQETLLELSDQYLEDIKTEINKKVVQNLTLSAFEQKAKSISSITEIVSDFALARAGCVTPHEFVYQQILNDAYRDEASTHFGDKYDTEAVQQVMDDLLKIHAKKKIQDDQLKKIVKNLLNKELAEPVHSTFFDKLTLHLIYHFKVAVKENVTRYEIPHFAYDMNIQNLYQHGFDMRNPYGSNLDGPWLLITVDGAVLYGDKQEQLIEVLLTGDFLQKNHIQINHGANFAAGWDKVIAKQLQLGQEIPPQTKENYLQYQKNKKTSSQRFSISGIKDKFFPSSSPDQSLKSTSTSANNSSDDEEKRKLISK